VPACVKLLSKPLAEYTFAPVAPPSDATTADCADKLTACDDKAAAAVEFWPTVGTYG
jgi:hypothetical protein